MPSLSIDSIDNGVVIDHIKAGNSMHIYNYLELGDLDCTVAIIKNVKSKMRGRKDIIKIENKLDIDFDVLGYIDPDITVNIIMDGEIIEKKQLVLPEIVKNVVKCKNPRCITSIEQEIEHVFVRHSENPPKYRCIYCEQEAKRLI